MDAGPSQAIGRGSRRRNPTTYRGADFELRFGNTTDPELPGTGATACNGPGMDMPGLVDIRKYVWKAPHLAGFDEDLSMAEYDQELDACGLNCPLPILRAKKALTKMTSGEVLRIIATDPGSVKDFEAFSRQTGNALLESKEDDGKFYFRMKKA